MNIICKKKCFDKNNSQYVIGGVYRYYESDYVYAIPYNEKLYNVYMEVNNEDIFMGTGSLTWINFHFEEAEETIIYRCICLESCIGANGRRYKNGKNYKYTIRHRHYNSPEEEKEYIMCDEHGTWHGYVKMSFIKRNFMEYNDYLNEYLQVDELFDNLLNTAE